MKYYSLIFINEYGQTINIDFGKQVKNNSKSSDIKDIDNWTKKYKNYNELINEYEKKYNVKIKKIEINGINIHCANQLVFNETIKKYGTINAENIYGKVEVMLKKNMEKRRNFINCLSHNKEKKYTINILMKWLEVYFKEITYKSLRDRYFEYIDWKEENNKLKDFYNEIKDAGLPEEPVIIKQNQPETKKVKSSFREKLIREGIMVYEDNDFDPDKYIYDYYDEVINKDELNVEHQSIKRTGKKR